MPQQIQQGQKQQPTTQRTIGQQTQPVEEKKSRWWIWLIIILVVVAIGAGIYFWLFL